MPIYEYSCNVCENLFEQRVPHMGDMAPCPKCGGTDVKRLISGAAVLVKGGGAEPMAACPSGMCGGMMPGGGCGMGGCHLD